MLIRTKQSIQFCCSLQAGHSLGNYFLQNDVQLWCSHFLAEGASTLLRHLYDITPGCFTNRLKKFLGVLGMQRRLGITLKCNIGNEFEKFFASYG